MKLDEIKEYLRIEHVEEDEVLSALQKASEEYMKNAGCVKNYDSELYKHAIKILISHWYDNRGITAVSNPVSYSIESIIYQIKNTRTINNEIDDK